MLHLTPWRVAAFVATILLVVYSLAQFSSFQDLRDKTAATIAHVTPFEKYQRPLVLYAYAESDTSRENLDFFVQKGIHGAADFVFIFNGPTNATGLIPNHPNVEVVERNNTCYDLGAFGEVLLAGDRWRSYKRFIVMNASVRGPFFPNYMKPCWTDAFLNRLNDRVKLVGTTINCFPHPHLQTMVLATDDVGMSILLNRELATSLDNVDKWGGKDDPVGFTACFENRNKAVHSEIGITGLIRSQGYDVDVMLTSFSVDEEDLTSYCAGDKRKADPLVDGHYFGANIHPYEMVFMKTNRHVAETTMKIMTEWHRSRGWSSWDACTAS